MLHSLNLTYPPTKVNDGLSQVWYLPLHAGLYLYGRYCAELVL